MLQPFLENCFTHAFQQVEPPWSIQINISSSPSDDGTWVISIKDNGIGFSQAALEQIQRITEHLHSGQTLELLEITKRGLGSVGVENTLTRCRMFWEDRVQFNVSNLPEGAEIRMIIRNRGETI
ncbi:sensor histidine kinase [Paenibacillus psychroresistens]|uniref:sensor histidine kinase n=1 Tax=Paenibacillus psychroresistens TaxID=1778678 RepID=UPI003863906F